MFISDGFFSNVCTIQVLNDDIMPTLNKLREVSKALCVIENVK